MSVEGLAWGAVCGKYGSAMPAKPFTKDTCNCRPFLSLMPHLGGLGGKIRTKAS